MSVSLPALECRSEKSYADGLREAIVVLESWISEARAAGVIEAMQGAIADLQLKIDESEHE